MVKPPEREGVPRPELLVEHLDRAIDDLVEKHWDQGQIIILKYLEKLVCNL